MTGAPQQPTLPEPLRRVVNLAKSKDDPRFKDHGVRYGTQRYREFEKKVDAIQAKEKSSYALLVQPYYSPGSYDCRPIPSMRPGSLMIAFTFYASLLSENTTSGQQEAKSLTYDAIKIANTTLSLGELTCFARDFRLVPYLISREGLRFAFQRHQISRKFMEHSQFDSINALRFEGFVEVLVRCALLAFPEMQNPMDRVAALSDYLELSDSAMFRKRIRAISRLVQARLMGPRAKHHTVDHVATDLQVDTKTHQDDIAEIEFMSCYEKRRHSKYLVGMKRLFNRALDRDLDEATKIALDWLPNTKHKKPGITKNSTYALAQPKDNIIKSPRKAKQQQRRLSTTRVDENIGYSDRERVHIRHRAKFAKADSLYDQELCCMLDKYKFEPGTVRWLPFGDPYIDMGVAVKGSRLQFKVDILNPGSLILACEAVLEGMPTSCSVTFDSRVMPQGFTRTMFIRVECDEPGEFLGQLVIQAFENTQSQKYSHRKLYCEEVCPIYLKIQDPTFARKLSNVKSKGYDPSSTPSVNLLHREQSLLTAAPTKRLTRQKSRGVVFGMSLQSPNTLPKKLQGGILEPHWLHGVKRPLPLQVSTKTTLAMKVRTPGSF